MARAFVFMSGEKGAYPPMFHQPLRLGLSSAGASALGSAFLTHHTLKGINTLTL